MAHTVKKLLIANRGEIALRVVRTAKEMGISTVAVYSEQDRNSRYVDMADEAYLLSGDTYKDTYLNEDLLIDILHKTGADAVHPGYGFLSEVPSFAQKVEDAGAIWVGPHHTALVDLGDKITARRVALRAKVPPVPGLSEPVTDVRTLLDFAHTHGYPIMMKRTDGGGGHGITVVHDDEELRRFYMNHDALQGGDLKEYFIEKFVDKARHVETQSGRDSHGNFTVYSTRDCSLQRRNQKLIEEAPAPFLPPETTRALEDAAVAICSSAHYESAGTVEFLVDPDGTMSFMEVNTRIQVEHPVTEEVTGVDLVAAQLAIAEGAHVTDIPGLEHGTPVPHGHAIEFRINAEDPSLGFVPFPGIVERLNVPTGPGIRFDSGVAQGGAIPGQFDSMIAKLIVSALSRSACLTRARHALDELAIAGVPTVRKFDQAVLEQPAFVATDGDFGVYTRWIEEEFLPSVDVRTLADGKPGRRAAAPEPVESWVEVDGKRVRLGLPASLASVAALGAGLDVEAPEGNMVIDIGGGSLEVAMGSDEDPTVALSVPAGAGRVTREFLPESGVADDDDLEAARKNIRKILEPMVKAFPKSKHPMHAVGTSKTIRSLARLAGAVMRQPGRVDTSIMTIDQLEDWLPRLAAIAPDQRTALPGVTPERTYQIVGGGLVIDEIMKALDVKEIEICPWALREGAILRWLDQFGRTSLGF